MRASARFVSEGPAVSAPVRPALEARLAALEARVEVLERGRGARSEGDDRVLWALADGTSGLVFTAAELLERRAFSPPLAAALAFYDSPKQVGKLLARLARRQGPIRVERLAQRGGVWYWRVQVLSEV